MGAWGPGLYSNDIALDVRDTYNGLLSDQMSNEDAYTETVRHCREIIETEEAPLFWLALAETQWRVGRLTPEVKAKALDCIEEKGGLALWKNDFKGGVAWQRTLSKLKGKLESPMPKERKFPRLEQNPWKLHDVYAYKLYGKFAEEKNLVGKYMLLQKIGEDEHGHGKRIIKHMQIQAIDHIFDALPTLEDINKYRILPMEDKLNTPFKDPQRPLAMNGYTYIEKPSEYPAKNLTFLGNVSGPANKHFAYKMIGWLDLGYHLCHNHEFWQGKTYEEVAEGVYNCIVDCDSHIQN